MEEAIYNGKPMVFVPFRHDQPSNAKKFTDKGLGKTIDYRTVNKAILKMTIQDIITNLT